MKVSSQQIHEIADELSSGMTVYINKDNLETKTIIDFDFAVGDTEFWQEELEKIETEWSNYAVLKKMESNEAFEIMEAFVDEVDDEILNAILKSCLRRKSPFANFKAEIDESAYRQKWFDFKQKKYEEYVKLQLVNESIAYE